MKSVTRIVAALGPIISALLFEGCDVRTREPALDRLIENNLQAVGGKAAVEAIESIQFELQISGSGFQANATYCAARPGRMRIEVNAKGKRVYAEAFDGVRAWQWKGKGEPIEESGVASAALSHGVELPGKLYGLHEMRGRGHKLELVGRELVDQVNYHVVQLTFSDGATTRLYFDPQSWLVTRRREVRPLHPDLDPTPTTIETRMSDFRKVGNLLFSFVSTDIDLNTGKLLETATVQQITLNPPLSPVFFEKLADAPAELKTKK